MILEDSYAQSSTNLERCQTLFLSPATPDAAKKPAHRRATLLRVGGQPCCASASLVIERDRMNCSAAVWGHYSI
jgi:hypothetical protein